MRFKREKKNIGDKRIISKFLFFPTTIDGETRWFETAKIEQCASYYQHDAFGGCCGYTPVIKNELILDYFWKNTAWVN